jgi:SAM-dependent methyltransferase
MTPTEINQTIGNIDIYLLDQLLKGRITQEMKILDAGSGEGRNLHYFIKNSYQHLYGIDPNPTAIQMLQMIAKYIPKEHFICTSIEEMPFITPIFDYVICNAVLHFANDQKHFEQLFTQIVKVLKPEGQLFIRMTSNHHMSEAQSLGEGIFNLPDGSKRYLLDIASIPQLLESHNLKQLEPIKTVHVHNQRSMTTLVLKKDK